MLLVAACRLRASRRSVVVFALADAARRGLGTVRGTNVVGGNADGVGRGTERRELPAKKNLIT